MYEGNLKRFWNNVLLEEEEEEEEEKKEKEDLDILDAGSDNWNERQRN